MEKQEPIIKVKNLYKSFKVGENKIDAIRGIDLQIYPEDFIVIFGPSGCGKSTLLNIILGLEDPESGEVVVRGTKIANLSEDEKGSFRARKFGMVYQMPNWIKSMSVLENVAAPLIIEGLKMKFALEKASAILKSLEIECLGNQLPTQLSGGQQQKAELARALIANPWIIMADEPTGNLDSESAEDVMNLLKKLNQQEKRTIILVTHNDDYWDRGTRRIEMKDGKITKDDNHG